jgi:hypothetical protein
VMFTEDQPLVKKESKYMSGVSLRSGINA